MFDFNKSNAQLVQANENMITEHDVLFHITWDIID